MIKYILISVSLCFGNALLAQANSEEAAKQTIERLFAGMQATDTAMVNSVFHKSAALQSVKQNTKGNTLLDNQSITEFLKQIAGMPKAMKIEERILRYEIKLDGIMASAWTPYEFYVNGKLSHCGVNSFQLIWQDERWQIVHVLDTRRKDCTTN